MQNVDQVLAVLPWLAGGIVFTLLVTEVISRIRVKALRREHEARIQRLENNVSVLTSGALGMGEKMLALESKFQSLQKTQEEFKNADLEFSYTQAQKLMSQGVDDGAIAANSGLSTTEINLMRMLQQCGQTQESENDVAPV